MKRRFEYKKVGALRARPMIQTRKKYRLREFDGKIKSGGKT